MAYQKGQSGNPKGRPPKGRALTELLEKELNRTGEYKGRRTAKKRVMARMVMEAITEGTVTLPGGGTLKVEGFDEWMSLVKWVYKHIDGDPPAEHNINTQGQVTLIFQPHLPDAEGDSSDE